MKDIRPRAEERARRRQEEAQRPPGTGFMSERTRAKEALRVEVNTYTGENVRKIAATAAAAEEDRILRVAAYCRVSTDDIDQLVSIEMQKNAYRDMIKANPKWKHVGTYVDEERSYPVLFQPDCTHPLSVFSCKDISLSLISPTEPFSMIRISSLRPSD